MERATNPPSETRPRPRQDRPLLVAAGWAVAGALAAREAGLLAACLVCLGAIAMSLWRRRAGAWIWALPAAFSATVTEPPCVWPRAGPVQFEGLVLAGVRRDARRGDLSFRVRHARQTFLCVVTHLPQNAGPAARMSGARTATANTTNASMATEFTVLPGDTVRGVGRVPTQDERRRSGRLPRVVTTAEALRVEPGPPGVVRTAARCRLAMQDALLRVVGGEAGVLLCHLVLGSGPRLTEDLVSAHRDTGLSHLLAVSGAHLTMLGWLLGFAFATCTRRSPLSSRRFRIACGVVLFFYGVITGMEPPVFRATVAAFVFLVGSGRGRPVPITAVLALPAIFTAVLAPQDLFGVSFNLSYAAVVGLSLSGGLSGRTFRERWIQGPLKCSLWATLCTAPLTLWYFGRIAPWTVFATPLLSPLVAGMLGLGLSTACLATVMPCLAAVLAWPLTGLTVAYTSAVRVTAELPWAPIFAATQPGAAAMAAAACVGVGVATLLCKKGRTGVAVLCVALSVPHFAGAPKPSPGLTMLAVGHGHAALLTLRDGTQVLVDCGSLGHARRAARAVRDALLPRRRLDWLVVTHRDFDHTGGILPLLDAVLVERALLPAEMRASPTARALLRQGCDLAFLAAGARCKPQPDLLVHRPTTEAKNPNDESAWVHAELGSFRAVLPGDALEACTADWLASDLACQTDVLVLPHHGRPHEGIPALLARTQPGLAIVSSATRDGPSAQTETARAAGCPILHTGLVGAIQVQATSPPTVTTERPRALRR